LHLFAGMWHCGAPCAERLHGRVGQSVCCDAAVTGRTCRSCDGAGTPSSPRAGCHSSRQRTLNPSRSPCAGHCQDRLRQDRRLCAAHGRAHHGPAGAREGRGPHCGCGLADARAGRADPQGGALPYCSLVRVVRWRLSGMADSLAARRACLLWSPQVVGRLLLIDCPQTWAW